MRAFLAAVVCVCVGVAVGEPYDEAIGVRNLAFAGVPYCYSYNL